MVDTARRPVGRLLQRGLDVTVATWSTGIFFPVALLIALAIRIESPGSPIYIQDRVGLGLNTFRMFKFRSMRDGCPLREVKTLHDPRVTRVGAVLRRLSLDEMPQMINVVKGDMTLVGPRPEILSHLPSYSNHHLSRFEVPPGLTGLWQVSGRSDLSLEQKLDLDLKYVANRSLLLDLKILALTPIAVISGRGAY